MRVLNKSTLKKQLTSECSLYDTSELRTKELPKYQLMPVPDMENVHVVMEIGVEGTGRNVHATELAAVQNNVARCGDYYGRGRNPMSAAADLLTQLFGESNFVLREI